MCSVFLERSFEGVFLFVLFSSYSKVSYFSDIPSDEYILVIFCWAVARIQVLKDTSVQMKVQTRPYAKEYRFYFTVNVRYREEWRGWEWRERERNKSSSILALFLLVFSVVGVLECCYEDTTFIGLRFAQSVDAFLQLDLHVYKGLLPFSQFAMVGILVFGNGSFLILYEKYLQISRIFL